jgi:putrescine transport system permease protein
MHKTSPFVKTATMLGYLFLYIPIILLIIYSFNESRLVTVWSGFSTKWYGELLRDRQLLQAAWVSFRVALMTAFGAVLLGTVTAYAINHYRIRPGGALFNILLKTPLVMPEVIMGFSLLLLFVAIEQSFGFVQRGILTIWIAHMTLSVAYVTIVVAARLREMDRSVLLAAKDLGAKPLTIFMRITLPLIAPALVCGWLLAFTLSFDDLVIASFVAGPQSTTLPMMVYSSVRLGVSPKINALATIMISIVTIMAVIFCLLMMRWERRQNR